jgi:hypothetical protein
MTYLEKILTLRKKVLNYSTESTKWLLSKIKKGDNKFVQITPTDFKVGGFYFMYYDIQGINKSSKLEQYVPFLIVDYNPNIDKKVLWIMNFNFIPLNIKEAFFVKFFNKFTKTLEDNENSKTVNEENTLPTINYENMWNETISYGIDYSIREIRLELINGLYRISTDNIHLLTTTNTKILTGVDEKKLTEIWITKLKNESLGERLDEKKIRGDYAKIVNELQKTFKFLDQKLKDL